MVVKQSELSSSIEDYLTIIFRTIFSCSVLLLTFSFFLSLDPIPSSNHKFSFLFRDVYSEG